MTVKVIKIAQTKWGNVRVSIPQNRWDDANTICPNQDASRKFICIKVRQRLKSTGSKVVWVAWRDIEFVDIDGPVRPVPTARQEFDNQVQEAVDWAVSQEELEETTELFPDFFQQPASYSNEHPCGCVPSRITRR